MDRGRKERRQSGEKKTEKNNPHETEVDLAVRIRLRKMGARNRPSYRFVVTDSRMPRDGRFIEILGYYSPIDKPAKVEVKEERMYYWLGQGATASDTVNSILKQIGLLRKWEMKKKGEDISQLALPGQMKDKAKKKKGKKGKAAEAAAAAEPTAPAEKAEGPEAKKEEKKPEPEPAQEKKETESAEDKEKKEQPKPEEKPEK
jgi:small subunit ribosomal protein S16